MNQSDKFKLLIECYHSDLQRLDAIQEAAWYFAQLHPIDGADDFAPVIESCEKERQRINMNLRDLEQLMTECPVMNE